MWYITIDGKKLPTPYQYFSDAMAEARRLKSNMIAVVVDCVYE